MGRDIFYEVRLLKALSNVILIDSRVSASAASLGNVFQCLFTLTLKNFFSSVQTAFTHFHFKTLAPCSVRRGRGEKSPSLL